METKKKTYKLFCYGTLKRGKSAHGLMKGATFLKEHSVNGTLYGATKDRAYPVAKFLTGSTIHGELYEITEDMLSRLDRYEGHPHLYKRRMLVEGLEDGFFVYDYQGDVSHMVSLENGRF